MKWVELSVEVHPEAVDAVAEVFHAHGTNGVSIEQPVQTDDEGELRPVFTGLPTLKAYLPATADVAQRERAIEEALWHLRAFDLSPLGPVQRSEIDEEDWAHGWKQHFHPLTVGNIVIKPSWREWKERPGDVVIELDPGMAFGTGLHPTTKLELAVLQELVRPGITVLDLGTGSAILALAAARLGAVVTAVDISEVAVQVARENVARNSLNGRIEVLEGTIVAIAGRQYGLILANIIARVLIEIAADLHAALEPDGHVLASGIIAERVDEVRMAFAGADLQIVDERREGDWFLLTARRRA